MQRLDCAKMADGGSLYITITGGGCDFLGEFTRYGGSSKFFIGAEVPYSETLSRKIIGEEKCTSKESAILLANHGRQFADIGFGVTSSLFSDGQRKNRVNQSFIAINNRDTVTVSHLVYKLFDDDDRVLEESTLSDVCIALLAHTYGLEVKRYWLAGIRCDLESYKLPKELEELL